MASITEIVAQIRQAVFGKDVRESIASGIESINAEVVSTTEKQAQSDTRMNNHTSGTAEKHAAENILYAGSQAGDNVKDAIDNMKEDIGNLTFTGSMHDALVTASLVDEEGEDFGPLGDATYLDGRLRKWEQKAITQLADITSRAINIKYPPVPFVGAKCDGVTDDTVVVHNLITHLGTKGGVILFPPEKVAVNLVVTASNITVIGTSLMDGMQNQDSMLMPFDLTKPVLQVGNDTGYVRNCFFGHLSIGCKPGSLGSKGVLVTGGAYRCTFTDITVANFTEYCWKETPGTTYPVSVCPHGNITIEPNTSTNVGGLIIEAPVGKSYNAGCMWDNLKVSGTNDGYSVIVDSVQFIASNTWIQGVSNHGVQLLKTNTTAPIIYGHNVFLDSDSPADNLIQVYATSIFARDVLAGSVSVDGNLYYTDATAPEPLTGFSTVGGKQYIPGAVAQLLTFIASKGASTGSNTSISKTGNDLYLNAGDGNLYLLPKSTGNAILQRASNPLFQITDSSLGKSASIALQSGVLYVGTPVDSYTVISSPLLRIGNTEQTDIMSGSGSPEGVKTAKPGSVFFRTDGGAITSFYVKESGTGNTGWIAK